MRKGADPVWAKRSCDHTDEPEPESGVAGIKLPVVARDPNEMAGMRQNTHNPDEPIRIDPTTGYEWFQEEVLKSAFAKPRGRRVLKYSDSGYKKETAVGEDGMTETFEVPGDAKVASEVKITLPSYQVGIYRQPGQPFKIITYNGQNGFDREDIENYYGGRDMVPEDVKQIYISNVLCYDIRTTVRNIETANRQLMLAGKEIS